MIDFPSKGPRPGPPGAPHQALHQAGPAVTARARARARKDRGNGVARPRTVLVLGGGGMRGMAHVGVLKAMAHARASSYDAIVGTSIGALVGAMAAGGFSLAEDGGDPQATCRSRTTSGSTS